MPKSTKSRSSEREEDEGGLDVLTTWNIWAIPLGSPRLFRRQKEWARFVDDVLGTHYEINYDDDRRFVVSCYQEAWRWRCGPLKCVFILLSKCGAASYMLFAIQFVAQFVSIILSWISPCIYWDAKDGLKHSSASTRYSIGINGMSAPKSYFQLMDSGLLIVSNRQPLDSGFEKFLDNSSGSWDLDLSRFPSRDFLLRVLVGISSRLETLVNKGILWGYWCDEATSIGTIVITTHLKMGARTQSIQNVKEKQLEQIVSLARLLRDTYGSRTKSLETYVCGDFNLCPRLRSDRKLLETFQARVGLKCVGPAWITNAATQSSELHTHVRGFQVDFIFRGEWKRLNGSSIAAHQCSKASVWRPPRTTHEGLLSDHYLVVSRRLRDRARSRREGNDTTREGVAVKEEAPSVEGAT